MTSYWLVKTEPNEYSYDDLERAGRDTWDGVRNHLAQKHLQAMVPGNPLFVYHTGSERAIIGVAEVVSLPYPDPSDQTNRFAAVDVVPAGRLSRPIALVEIKQIPEFARWELVRLPRLSVMPVPPAVWNRVIQLATT